MDIAQYVQTARSAQPMKAAQSRNTALWRWCNSLCLMLGLYLTKTDDASISDVSDSLMVSLDQRSKEILLQKDPSSSLVYTFSHTA